MNFIFIRKNKARWTNALVSAQERSLAAKVIGDVADQA